jgi:hypothetical protein
MDIHFVGSRTDAELGGLLLTARRKLRRNTIRLRDEWWLGSKRGNKAIT